MLDPQEVEYSLLKVELKALIIHVHVVLAFDISK